MFPVLFTMLGMLLEPLSNYFDRHVMSPVFKIIPAPKRKHADDEDALRELIRERYLGEIGKRIENHYALCKEYVETRQLSTTFMVFLSRYGFYRNVAFICVMCAVAAPLAAEGNAAGWVGTLVWLMLAYVFKSRAQDFFAHMAPAVYRAFLIEKLAQEKSVSPGQGDNLDPAGTNI
jgi:AcrR family transcriptional regulator